MKQLSQRRRPSVRVGSCTGANIPRLEKPQGSPIPTPIVSVIICTYDRPLPFARALRSVLVQDWRDFEIIVVDDGSKSSPSIPRRARHKLNLLRTDHQGIGAARATGLSAARAPWVAYCDDDDEWTSNHLSTLLTYLQDHPDTDLVYCDSEWKYHRSSVTDTVTRRSIEYSFDYDLALLGWNNYIFASDVIHRASAARDAGGFDPSLQAFEDWDLWLRLSERYSIRHLPVMLGVHHWHEHSVSSNDNFIQRERVVRQHQRLFNRLNSLSPDGSTVGAATIAPFDRSTWHKGRKELIWRSPLLLGHSYSYASRQILLSLEQQGVDITVVPWEQPPAGFERFYKPFLDWRNLALYFDYRRRPSVMKSERLIVYCMWETTLIPRKLIEEINDTAKLLFVPCQQNFDSYRECGIRIPIKVLHLGVNQKQFPFLFRQGLDIFTFGTFGELSPRKGIDVLIRAFQDEFSKSEPVRLLLKTTSTATQYPPLDSRIELLSEFLDHEGLLRLLSRMNAFVMPSRGEGFGLCALEAMSTGLPVIATNWSGPAEYLDPDYSYPLSYRLVDADGTEANAVRYSGKWAEPDYEHLRFLMRWLYEHPEEREEKGRKAAERTRMAWTWDRVASQICSALDEIARQ